MEAGPGLAKRDGLLIGIGNDFRTDDGVGLYVARRMKEAAIPGWTVLEREGEATALLSAWENVDRVVVVDAVRSGNLPGTLMEFDATRESLPVDWFGVSTHAFGLPQAIELCRVLGRLPGRIVVMGIEGRNFEPGCGLCPDVRKTADALADRLETELRTGFESGPGRGKDGAQGVGGRYSERSM